MTIHTAFDCMAGMATALLVVAGLGGAAITARTQAPEARVIEVVAKRFTFEPSRIEVAEGDIVRLIVRSADGVHGISIKKFKVSEEIPRGGKPVEVEFIANSVGEFTIRCSEYCGRGHEEMSGKLVVRAREGGRR